MDQNDNTPVIVSPWRAHGSVVEEKIPRSTDKGTLIAKVIAIDTDSVHNSRITYQFLQNTDATLFSLDQYNGEIRTTRMFSYRDSRYQRLVVIAKDNGDPSLSATVTIKLSTVETALKSYADMTEVPLEYDIFSDLNLYLVIGLGSVSFLLLITILVTIVLKCQKPKPSKAAPPCRNSVISERNSTIADSTLVSNDAYWYSLFLAETRKGKLVVRQPVPKGTRYIVSSIPRSTGLTETSDSAASTLQIAQPNTSGTNTCDDDITLPLNMDLQDVCKHLAEDLGIPWASALKETTSFTKGSGYPKTNVQHSNFCLSSQFAKRNKPFSVKNSILGCSVLDCVDMVENTISHLPPNEPAVALHLHPGLKSITAAGPSPPLQ
ncbi:hypothetical protein PHYPO_G00242150 [Pangasianodon hypophthalmus]|uniref:Cadherin domain-containing protein n=1 Tax=Pangasianodon hypophthalmus TaxID=310915 RepID=A0A5N5NER1_PANHP|nr:hypothetical protein PHYPO_G00242150 [Pangasianodon hypophthalmus]